MDDGDDQFTEENLAATENALQDYMVGLFRLQAPTEKKIIKVVKETVLRINALNEKTTFSLRHWNGRNCMILLRKKLNKRA